MEETQFGVLFVCTGNVCRSPLAEQLFRARLDAVGMTFSSSGTYALVGSSMPEQAAAESRSVGGAPDGHEPRQLTAEHIDSADLVLALTREHRADIARILPRAAKKSYTLREFARIIEGVAALPDGPIVADAGSLAELFAAIVPELTPYRGYFPRPADPADDDVIDPYLREPEIYAETTRQIVDATDRIMAALRQVYVPA